MQATNEAVGKTLQRLQSQAAAAADDDDVRLIRVPASVASSDDSDTRDLYSVEKTWRICDTG